MITLSDFNQPLVKKAEMIPWDKIEEKYAKQTGELSSAHLLTIPSSKVNSPTKVYTNFLQGFLLLTLSHISAK